MHPRSRRGRPRRRGFTLLSSAFFVSALLVVGLSLLSLAATTRRLANNRMYRVKALNLAIAGVDEAVAQYSANRTFMTAGQSRTYTVPGENGGSITLAMTDTSGVKQVTSTATVAGYPSSYTRAVRVTLGTGNDIPVFRFGISSKLDMTISGGSQTTSLPTPGGGSVHSNGNMTLSGGLTVIDGIASAVGSVSNSGATVTGGTRPNSAPIDFPDIDQAFKDQSLVNGTTTASSTTLNGGAAQIMRGKYAGSVSIGSSGCTIQDGSVVWITGALQIDGPIRGTGTIVVDGKITGSGGSFTPAVNVLFVSTFPRTASNPTATASNQDAITLSGGSTAYGWFYAPYARLTTSGGTDVFGGISGMAVVISGGSLITVPNDGRVLPPGSGRTGAQGWEELQ